MTSLRELLKKWWKLLLLDVGLLVAFAGIAALAFLLVIAPIVAWWYGEDEPQKITKVQPSFPKVNPKAKSTITVVVKPAYKPVAYDYYGEMEKMPPRILPSKPRKKTVAVKRKVQKDTTWQCYRVKPDGRIVYRNCIVLE